MVTGNLLVHHHVVGHVMVCKPVRARLARMKDGGRDGLVERRGIDLRLGRQKRLVVGQHGGRVVETAKELGRLSEPASHLMVGKDLWLAGYGDHLGECWTTSLLLSWWSFRQRTPLDGQQVCGIYVCISI